MNELQDGLFLVAKKDRLGDHKYCELYFLHLEFAFPSRGWIDLCGVISDWREEAKKLASDGACELWFLDGPYQVTIVRLGNLYEFSFAVRHESTLSLQKVITLTKENSVDNILRSLENY